ncbi:MAG TPA: hypothetical protein VHD33_02000 [Legionellaceae bacterium]|nr:hypothetical protein [Legionellaceae bacterium]
MKRLLLIFIWLSKALWAAHIPGDINFNLEDSFEQHAYKFRLVINEHILTHSTPCISPGDRFTPTLTYGSIGLSNAKITIQASDCTDTKEQWITLANSLEYDNDYWYDVYINMLDHSFHF